MSSALRIHFNIHWLGYVVAFVIGCVMILPNVWLRLELGNAYQGVNIADIDNDVYYYARVKAAYDGNAKITEATMNIEDADKLPYTAPPLGENIVAWTAQVLGLEPRQMIVVGNFLYTFLLALVWYALAWTITKSKAVAVLTPLTIMLASNIVFNPRNIWYVLFEQERIWHNVYNRPVHPQISSLFFYTWLLAMVRLVLWRPDPSYTSPYQGEESKYKYPLLAKEGLGEVLAGLLFGALFYIYPYSWMYAGAILFVCAVVSLVRRDYVLFQRFFAIGLIGLIVSIPNWMNYYHFIQHPLFEVMQKRFVLFPSRAPVWSTLLAIDFVLLYFLRIKLEPPLRYFIPSVYLAGILILNQQIITGVRLFPGHWHWYYIVPISIFIVLWALWEGVQCVPGGVRRFLKPVVIISIVAFVLADGVFAQRTYYEDNRSHYTYYQRYAGVYQWLNQNVARDSVVLSDLEFSERLPLWTSLRRYLFRPTDELFFVPTEHIKHAFFTKLFLQGVSAETVNQFITQDTYELKEILFGYYRRYTQGCQACYTPTELENLRQEYRDFATGNFEQLLKKHKIDYAVWDTVRYPQYRFDQYAFMQKEAEINNLNIYRIK